jgi:hypothetical protein
MKEEIFDKLETIIDGLLMEGDSIFHKMGEALESLDNLVVSDPLEMRPEYAERVLQQATTQLSETADSLRELANQLTDLAIKLFKPEDDNG